MSVAVIAVLDTGSSETVTTMVLPVDTADVSVIAMVVPVVLFCVDPMIVTVGAGMEGCYRIIRSAV